jgi:hypothetical protein
MPAHANNPRMRGNDLLQSQGVIGAAARFWQV